MLPCCRCTSPMFMRHSASEEESTLCLHSASDSSRHFIQAIVSPRAKCSMPSSVTHLASPALSCSSMQMDKARSMCSHARRVAQMSRYSSPNAIRHLASPVRSPDSCDSASARFRASDAELMSPIAWHPRPSIQQASTSSRRESSKFLEMNTRRSAFCDTKDKYSSSTSTALCISPHEKSAQPLRLSAVAMPSLCMPSSSSSPCRILAHRSKASTASVSCCVSRYACPRTK
mmetsp:Transcript_17722/g.26028  ORF Transcript_17722/g.26028 Transcript_17722/m.26028 type:complete len:231 (-) Transcript_17722:427-1119(-)